MYPIFGNWEPSEYRKQMMDELSIPPVEPILVIEDTKEYLPEFNVLDFVKMPFVERICTAIYNYIEN
jgi:hypothetical protein